MPNCLIRFTAHASLLAGRGIPDCTMRSTALRTAALKSPINLASPGSMGAAGSPNSVCMMSRPAVEIGQFRSDALDVLAGPQQEWCRVPRSSEKPRPRAIRQGHGHDHVSAAYHSLLEVDREKSGGIGIRRLLQLLRIGFAHAQAGHPYGQAIVREDFAEAFTDHCGDAPSAQAFGRMLAR